LPDYDAALKTKKTGIPHWLNFFRSPLKEVNFGDMHHILQGISVLLGLSSGHTKFCGYICNKSV